MSRSQLTSLVERLHKQYGDPVAPPPTDPFGLILWEQVAYLANDERRAEARRTLNRFPMIGEPGADKILMLTRTHPVLALDSNGLRVLVRVGYGEEGKSYATTYRNVQKALAPVIRPDFDWLIAAHGLLRRHGQVRCTHAAPGCTGCCLRKKCGYARTGWGSA